MTAAAASGLVVTVLRKLHTLRGILVEQSSCFKRDLLDEEKELEFLELIRAVVARNKLEGQQKVLGLQNHSQRKPSVRFATHLDIFKASRPETASRATESPAIHSRRQSAATGIIKLNALKYFPSPTDADGRGTSMMSKGSKRSLSSGHQRHQHIEPFDGEQTDRVDLTKYKKTFDSSSFSLRINKRLSLRDSNLVKLTTDNSRRRRPNESFYNIIDHSRDEQSRLAKTERNTRMSIDNSSRSGTKVFNIVHQPDKTV